MIEILAPAGDIECAYAAINSGANAIYLGLTSFSARSSATNFDEESLKNLIKYAHYFDVKIYVAMNTLIKQKELQSFLETAIRVWGLGVDAIIVQDIFVGKALKEAYPNLVLHLSTQAGVNNVYGAMLAKRYGFSRVILARETPIEEIKKIAQVLETECFVQGALCTCFSGQCYLSSFAGGNSGNRGKCKQPCRKRYTLLGRGENKDKNYAISLSDLSVGEKIFELIDAGVVSFKIEGRMRRPEYVASAVSYYRALIEGNCGTDKLSDLKRTYNRGNYTKGLAFGQDKNFISSAIQGHIGEFFGTVKVENGKYFCLSKNRANVGDGFKIVRNGKELCGALCVEITKKGTVLQSKIRLKNGDKAFITTDKNLTKRLLDIVKKKSINVEVHINFTELPYAIIDGVKYFGEDIVQPALKSPITTAEIENCFLKTDNYPFNCANITVNLCGEFFIPKSKLNEFRRSVYARYYDDKTKNTNTQYTFDISKFSRLLKVNCGEANKKIAVIANDFKGINCNISIVKPKDYSLDFSNTLSSFNGEKFLYLPAFASTEFLDSLADKLSVFDGVYCEGTYGVEYAKKYGKKLFAGFGFNLSNTMALNVSNTYYACISKELTQDEAKDLICENTFYLTRGDIKVMDVIYCPFGKNCKGCNFEIGALVDENDRTFPLKRYKTNECRFELYNCSVLLSNNNFTGAIYDCSITDYSSLQPSLSIEQLKEKHKNYTSGHTKSPIY